MDSNLNNMDPQGCLNNMDPEDRFNKLSTRRDYMLAKIPKALNELLCYMSSNIDK